MSKLLCFLVLGLSVSSFAKPVPFPIGTKVATCAANAEAAIDEMTHQSLYDQHGFSTLGCATADYRTEVICEVKVTRESGSVTDYYQVNLNRTCSKVHHIQLTGMGD